MGKSDVKTVVVGAKASLTREITSGDIQIFADLSGDHNPVHLDGEYAKDTIFGEPIAHGLLSAGFISAVLGMQLPGPGAVYREQTLSFLAPVKAGDTITAEVEVLEVDSKGKNAIFRTFCRNQHGIIVLEGRATLSLPRK